MVIYRGQLSGPSQTCNAPNVFIQKNVVFGVELSHVLPSVSDAIRIIVTFEFDVVLASLDIA